MRSTGSCTGSCGPADVSPSSTSSPAPSSPSICPVPWAEEPTISFLEPADAVRAAVEAAGFWVELWEDTSAEALAFMARLTEGPPPLVGLHLLLPDFPTKAANARRNLEEDRIRTQRCVATA